MAFKKVLWRFNAFAEQCTGRGVSSFTIIDLSSSQSVIVVAYHYHNTLASLFSFKLLITFVQLYYFY